MTKYILLSVLFMLASMTKGFSQVQLMPNMVLTQEFVNEKDIYSTFTQGVVNYEAQIMYIYGEVYVTSQMPDSATHKLPTLRSSYLMPIYSQYKKNGGKVHENYEGEMYLFLNVKFDIKKTYQKIWEQLSPYNELLTYRIGPQWHDGKLRIIFTGNAPMKTLQQERVSFAGVQGTVSDLEKNYDSKMMPIIGVDFNNDFSWNGIGKMPFDEFMKFKDIISKSHAQGKKVRVFNCPDEENVWDVLVKSGVDLINSTNAIRFNTFVSQQK